MLHQQLSGRDSGWRSEPAVNKEETTSCDLLHGDRICGAVDYDYKIGKFEFTAGQYTEFLNAVAATDPHGLYNTGMWTNSYGCKIERTGSPGSYSYSVAPERSNRPVGQVNWGDAARFANWLHNGQPGLELPPGQSVPQDENSTEDGSYYLNGAMSNAALLAVVREPDATWVIPSEDEWYKAAYHKNDGVTGNYFDYPTSSDSTPSDDLIDPDPGNNATFVVTGDHDYTIGSPYYRTEVGEFENSESPYGTFDQGGNVWEWNEAVLVVDTVSYRGRRGSSFGNYAHFLEAASRDYCDPSFEDDSGLGFRVAEVSEQTPVPAVSEWGLIAMTLLMLTAGTLVYARRRARVNAAA